MQTFASVEGHPVIHRSLVILSVQDSISLLVGDLIDSRMGRRVFRHISGNKITVHDDLAVFIEIKMLGSQIDLYISVSVVFRSVGCGGFGKLRKPCLGKPLGDGTPQPIRFSGLIHSPAVAAAADVDVLSPGRVQRFRAVVCVIVRRDSRGESGDLVILQRDRASALNIQPVVDHLSGQHQTVAFRVPDVRTDIPVQVPAELVQDCIVLRYRRRCIHSADRLKIDGVLHPGHGGTDAALRQFPVDLAALVLADHAVARAALVL